MTERLRLTFDFDGVLCRQPFGINPGQGRSKRRDAPGKRGALWATERWRYHLRRPMRDAAEGFQALAARYDCVVLSARSDGARGLTEAWLRRHLGVVPEVNLRPHWRETSAAFKARRVLELAPFAHFEDDPHTAEWLAELIPHVFLVDWPRNRWLEAPNIHRITTLADALPVLERLTHRGR